MYVPKMMKAIIQAAAMNASAQSFMVITPVFALELLEVVQAVLLLLVRLAQE